MVAPKFTGRSWAEEDQEQPTAAAATTEAADIAQAEQAVLAKRQLGFALTLGDAVFSIGLDSNGLPAFTIGGPTPTPAPAPAPAPTTNNLPTTQVPPPTIPTATPIQTLASPSPTTLDTVPVDTVSGNTGLPTAPLSTPTLSSSTRSSITRTGLQTTTIINFLGGSAVTSVTTVGTAAADKGSGGLSPPAIAGVVVGVVGGIAAMLLLLVLCVRWRRHVRDRKRKSATESVRALHTGPAPMMAHNSARYTNMFPNGGRVMSDADSAKMAFLPAGAAGFLNRASGSPLHSPLRPDSPMHYEALGTRSPNHLSVPPSPTVPSKYKSGASAEVAFLAADASNWLNRQSTMTEAGPSNAHERMPSNAAAVIASHSNNASTRSLPSQLAPRPEHGSVTFLPGTASAFLNKAPGSPLQQSSDPSSFGPSPPMAAAAFSNASTRSLPSQVAPPSENGQVSFLPGDASAFLNRSASPMQSQGTASTQPFPPPPQSVSTNSSAPYHTPAPANGQVTFLPADASGFLNRNSAGPLGVPYPQTPPPVPSSYNPPPMTTMAPMAAALAVPAPAHTNERDSANTTSNQLLNDNPEWFGSDYHNSRQMSPAVAAAPTTAPAPAQQPQSRSNDEIDSFLSGYSQPVPDSYGPPQSTNPFQPPQFGSPAQSSPDHLTGEQVSQQDYGHPNLLSGAARTPDVQQITPPPTSVPSSHKMSWLPPSVALPQPTLPNVQAGTWYQPQSPAMNNGQSDNGRVMSWPKPPDVDWDRPRVRPRGV